MPRRGRCSRRGDAPARPRPSWSSWRHRGPRCATKLEDFLLAGDEDFDSLIVEIRAGTGGDEAALFAGDLYEMYTPLRPDAGLAGRDDRVQPRRGRRVQGGHLRRQRRRACTSSCGTSRGGHRVQRVPATETQGRIHTSAATVAVLPEPDEAQVEIRPQDIEWERMRAGGAGGQHVNKTESAVRIWYKKGTPDEMEVKCQDERSQHKNYDQAMRILRSRLFERQQEKLHKRAGASMRKTLIGSGDRSDRIRTYNFPQNRLTDHRIDLTLYKLDAIMAGEMGELLEALRQHDRKQRLEGGGAG